MAKRLTRSRAHAMLGGVCAGLGDYFEVDENFIRLLFVVFALFDGIGVLIYLALWLIVPEADASNRSLAEGAQQAAEDVAQRFRKIGTDVRDAARSGPRRSALVLSLLLVLIGTAFLLHNIGIRWMRWFSLATLWPVLPIGVGIALFWQWMKGRSGER